MAKAAGGGMKGFYALLGLLAVGGGVALFLMTRSKQVSIPANVTVTAEDTLGFRGFVLGDSAASVEIVEYADYQCPACASFDMVQFPDVKRRLIETGRLRWRYRDFPLAQHQHSRMAAHAAACADEQGKYWPVHGLIYEAQSDWATRPGSAADDFRDLAKAAGVDLAAYDACMQSARHAGRIEASLQEGTRLGVNSTPTFLVAGRLYPGILPADRIEALVDSLAKAAAPK